MFGLIKAGYVRLFKSKGFYVAMLFMIIGAALWLNKDGTYWGVDGPNVCDYHTIKWFSLLPIGSAIMTGLFCFDDYSGGSIRLKITVGNTKSKVYYSNLIVCVGGTALLFLTGVATTTVMALIKHQIWLSSPTETLYAVAVAAVMIFSSASVSLIFAMLIDHPAAAALAIALVLSIALCITSAGTSDILNEPEYRISYGNQVDSLAIDRINQTSDYDEQVRIAMEYGYAEPNPNYIGGVKRVIYSAVAYFLPAGQAPMLYSAIDDAIFMDKIITPVKGPILCMLFSISLSIFGAAVFNRKNLR